LFFILSGIGFNCPVERLEWIAEQNNRTYLDCYFVNGDGQRGKCRGLYEIAIELGLIQRNTKIMLPALRDILRSHPAFSVQTKLETLAKRYNVKIIYLPKFHCVMNPIEGMWAYQKQYLRKANDQSNFENFKSLFMQSRELAKQNTLYCKLRRRFWRTCFAYEKGLTYGDVLDSFRFKM
jgi:transposase